MNYEIVREENPFNTLDIKYKIYCSGNLIKTFTTLSAAKAFISIIENTHFEIILEVEKALATQKIKINTIRNPYKEEEFYFITSIHEKKYSTYDEVYSFLIEFIKQEIEKENSNSLLL